MLNLYYKVYSFFFMMFKTTFLTICIFIASLPFAFAQNVGIGTVASAAKLEILGVGNTSTTAALLAKNSSQTPSQVFVFGKEIPDFRGVDYDRIFLLGMASIQELDQKVTDLEALKAEMAQMRAEINALKANK